MSSLVEKLAIEHGATIETGDHDDLKLMKGEVLFEDLAHLEAFAKALQQSSEPFIYINKDAWKTGKLDWCTPEYKKGNCDNFKHRYTMPLYEHPPVQSSEPVGDFYFANDEWHYVPEKVKAHVSKIFTLVKLFTHPPASVPKADYDKLLDALKLAKVTFIANKMDVRNVMEVINEEIAEAEVKS